jgi:Histidine-specific methyltransferase, SAM-dependent
MAADEHVLAGSGTVSRGPDALLVLTAAQASGQTGIWAAYVAAVPVALGTPHPAQWLSVLAAAWSGPFVLSRLAGGPIDRYGPRMVAAVSWALTALAAAVPLVVPPDPAVATAVLAVMAAAGGWAMPAGEAAPTWMPSKPDLAQAGTWLLIATSLPIAAGPALRSQLVPGDTLLLGTDLTRDPAKLIPAYDDPAGITAAFITNALVVLTQALAAGVPGAGFDPDLFDYTARWDPARNWVEMLLRATQRHNVALPTIGLTILFAEGETLRTEISAKFTLDQVADELAAARFGLIEWRTDPAAQYGGVVVRSPCLTAIARSGCRWPPCLTVAGINRRGHLAASAPQPSGSQRAPGCAVTCRRVRTAMHDCGAEPALAGLGAPGAARAAVTAARIEAR